MKNIDGIKGFKFAGVEIDCRDNFLANLNKLSRDRNTSVNP